MQDHRHDRPVRSGAVLRWAERLLVTAGAAMLAWWALLVADAELSQRAARQSLEAAWRSSRSVSLEQPRGEDAAPAPAAAPAGLEGSAIATLSIPRVHLSAVVLHGSDSRTLRRGPGHLENTALPGDSGNVVIAGHRDSFFRPLRHVEVGDDIFLDTPHGRSHYRVTSLQVVRPSDVSVLAPTDAATLTLITCYPFWVLGNAPDRFVVRAARLTAPTPVMATAAPPAPESSVARQVAPAAANGSAATKTMPLPDDVTLVRQAIESFRITYNGRWGSNSDVGSAPLVFRACDVSVIDDRAEAACGSSQLSGAGEPHVRTFALERVDAGWAIRSIVIRQEAP
jgi:sortase A